MSKIVFDIGNSELLDEWKRAVLSLYGIGGIKKRIIEIISEDLKNIKKKSKHGDS